MARKRARHRTIRTVLGITLLGAALVASTAYLSWFGYLPPTNFTESRADRALLVARIESYMTVDEWIRYASANSLEYGIEAHANSNRARPPFDVTVATVPKFTLFGGVGSLQADFFNNRLAAIRFFPEHFEEFAARLAADGIDLRGRPEARVGRHMRIWSATDAMGKRYVGWEDVRLRKEMDVWIKRYS